MDKSIVEEDIWKEEEDIKKRYSHLFGYKEISYQGTNLLLVPFNYELT